MESSEGRFGGSTEEGKQADEGKDRGMRVRCDG